MDKPLDTKPVRMFILFSALALFLWIVYLARAVLLPFVLAFGIAHILDPVIDRLERLGVSRIFAIILSMLILFTMMTVTIAIVAPIVWGQMETMVDKVPGYADYVEKEAAPWFESVTGMEHDKLKSLVKTGLANMGDLPVKIIKTLSKGVWSGLSNLMGFLTAIINLAILPVAVFYLLKDFDLITAKIHDRIPPRNRERATVFLKKINETLNSFLRGQLLAASIMALILSVGLFFIGAPMGIVIGIVAGLSNIVPYLSIIFGLAPALLMTYLEFQDLLHPGLVLALFITAQALDGFIIAPRILEKAVGLHPVAVMASLLIGAHFFGFLGLLLATPVAAVVKVAMDDMDGAYLKSEFFATGSGEKPDG